MSLQVYSLAAGIIFLVVTLVHLARVVFGTPIIVQGAPIPV